MDVSFSIFVTAFLIFFAAAFPASLIVREAATSLSLFMTGAISSTGFVSSTGDEDSGPPIFLLFFS